MQAKQPKLKPKSFHSKDFVDSRAIATITENDVLLGRGKETINWKGNVSFREIINKSRIEYVGTPHKNGKHLVAERVYYEVLARGGRFLKSSGESVKKRCWLEQNKDVSVLKIKQAFQYQLYQREQKIQALITAEKTKSGNEVAKSRHKSTLLTSIAREAIGQHGNSSAQKGAPKFHESNPTTMDDKNAAPDIFNQQSPHKNAALHRPTHAAYPCLARPQQLLTESLKSVRENGMQYCMLAGATPSERGNIIHQATNHSWQHQNFNDDPAKHASKIDSTQAAFVESESMKAAQQILELASVCSAQKQSLEAKKASAAFQMMAETNSTTSISATSKNSPGEVDNVQFHKGTSELATGVANNNAALSRTLKNLKEIHKEATMPIPNTLLDDPGEKLSFLKNATMPLPEDVLTGFAESLSQHQGNVRLKELILKHKRRFLSSSLKDREIIAQQVMDEITSRKGRFLKLCTDVEPGVWLPMENNACLRKIKRTFFFGYGPKSLDHELPHLKSIAVKKFTDNDVLLGGSRLCINNPGNIKYRALLSSRMMAYLNCCTDAERDRIAHDIKTIVESKNGRFLHLQPIDNLSDTWVLANDDFIVRKIKSSFQNRSSDGLDKFPPTNMIDLVTGAAYQGSNVATSERPTPNNVAYTLNKSSASQSTEKRKRLPISEKKSTKSIFRTPLKSSELLSDDVLLER